MNNTNIPPKKTKNIIYENQNVLVISPDIKQINVVWTSNVNPIAKGCFMLKKIKLKINNKVINDHWKISRSSLS